MGRCGVVKGVSVGINVDSVSEFRVGCRFVGRREHMEASYQFGSSRICGETSSMCS